MRCTAFNQTLFIDFFNPPPDKISLAQSTYCTEMFTVMYVQYVDCTVMSSKVHRDVERKTRRLFGERSEEVLAQTQEFIFETSDTVVKNKALSV